MLDLETIETDAGDPRARPLTWGDVREDHFQKSSFSRVHFKNESDR